LDIDNEPLFPFGFGLSYAQFCYRSIQLSQPHLKPTERISVSVVIENTSEQPGYETIQLYIRDHFAKLSRPVKELKQFKKVWFEGKMKQTVTFSVSLNDLTYRLADGTETYDLGTFTIFVGSQSNAELSADFKLY
jgi:beta-glucosidase